MTKTILLTTCAHGHVGVFQLRRSWPRPPRRHPPIGAPRSASWSSPPNVAKPTCRTPRSRSRAFSADTLKNEKLEGGQGHPAAGAELELHPQQLRRVQPQDPRHRHRRHRRRRHPGRQHQRKRAARHRKPLPGLGLLRRQPRRGPAWTPRHAVRPQRDRRRREPDHHSTVAASSVVTAAIQYGNYEPDQGHRAPSTSRSATAWRCASPASASPTRDSARTPT